MPLAVAWCPKFVHHAMTPHDIAAPPTAGDEKGGDEKGGDEKDAGAHAGEGDEKETVSLGWWTLFPPFSHTTLNVPGPELRVDA